MALVLITTGTEQSKGSPAFMSGSQFFDKV